MDEIILQELQFYGYHGAFEEEQRLGQRFIIDLILRLPLQKAGRSDQLADTINYADVYELVRKVVEEEKYRLLERLAEEIAQRLLHVFPIEQVELQVMKPNPPISGNYRAVGVKIIRGK
ncbi:dihydroneopterin aldolase [Rubeoparvulum massiliense]|uniref:dihydroneopterin aldolase n=1 Tax=Rubeoparvulum massiliense TaxID=1631346 RepID=UPI00065E9A33|nr:dihydroneopterin aldolase [Rubeoparvulum massiliense]